MKHSHLVRLWKSIGGRFTNSGKCSNMNTHFMIVNVGRYTAMFILFFVEIRLLICANETMKSTNLISEGLIKFITGPLT